MGDISIFDLHNSMRNSFYDKKPEKYIDIDEGWYKLVLQCHIELLNADPHYRIHQITQKFGVLHFIAEPSDEYWETPEGEKTNINAVIARYEALSRVTCEATGRPGLLMKSPGGWYKTLNPRWAAQNPPFDRYREISVPTGYIALDSYSSTSATGATGATGGTGPAGPRR